MKNRAIKIISLILGLLMAASNGAYAAKERNMQTAEVWTRTDVILTTEKKYDNPYLDVDIDAEFVHEDGTTIRLYGFWNGGGEWRVRFAPTKTGYWNYTVTCSDTDNADLHLKKGVIRAVKNTGKTELDRRGFVKISDDGRYFVYDDGTPFYWLGDTNWQAPNYVSISRCNYPGCECGSQFFHEVNDRVDKGFTVYQTYFDSAESDGGGQLTSTPEVSMWSSKYTKINPKTFSNKYDVMFDYLAAKGMTIALGFGVHDNTVKNMSRDALDRLSRYLTARYAAYPVIWITAQEITGEAQFDAWMSSARITAAGDGYHHPQGAHQYPVDVNNEFIRKLDKENWHNFYALQSGHGQLIQSKFVYQGYWSNRRNKDTAKPFVETEANYEDIYCGAFNAYDASRISAWKANLCGSYGFTYGVTGIWANCYSTAGNTGWLGSYSTEPWYMGLDKPGSYEMKYMARFFKYVGFNELVPRFTNTLYSNLKEETKVVASTEDNKTYVAYFYNTDQSTGTLKKLNVNEKYSAKWYDVLTGKFIQISDDIPHEEGKYDIPEKPDCADWVLLVTSRTDLGVYETELQRPYTPVVTDVNFLIGATATASSVSAPDSSPDKAIDESSDTWWCASNASLPQWLCFDIGSVKQFDTIMLRMYPRTGRVSYTVEISLDGSSWQTVHNGEKENPRAADDAAFDISFDKIYEFRYMRFTFSLVTGNWAAVVEAEAYVSGDKKDRAEFGGVVQSPEVECVGGYIYSADGKGKDTLSNVSDGDTATEWKPFAPEATQTFIMDLHEVKDVYGVEIIPGKNAEIPDYRLEGSEDGESWTIIANSAVNGKSIVKEADKNNISEPADGRYRYIKLIYMGGSGKKAVKTIAEIRIYAEGATAEAEKKADVSELLKTYTEYKKIKNTKGEYYSAAYRDFLNALGDAAKIISCKTEYSEQEVKAAESALTAAYNGLSEEPQYEPYDTEAPKTDALTNGHESDSNTGAEQPVEDDDTEFPTGAVIIGASALIGGGGVAAALISSKKRDKKKKSK